MDEKRTSTTAANIIAGVLCCLLSLGWLAALDYAWTPLFPFFWLAGYIVCAVALFRGRRQDPLLLIGFAILCAAGVGSLLSDLFYPGWSGWYLRAVPTALAMLAGTVSMLLLCISQTTSFLTQQRDVWKKIWFLPAACMAASLLLSIILLPYASPHALAAGIAFLLTGLWLCRPEDLESAQPYAPAPGYNGIVKHVLLLFFTLGIWYLIWVYRQTRFLNRSKDAPPRTPGTEVLLCLFIPFYSCFWTYKSAQRLRALTAEAEVPCETSTFYLVLSFFGWLLAPIIMQDQINTYLLATGEIAPPPPPAPKATGMDPVEQVLRYKTLLDQGVLSQEEFEQKKREILELD